MSDMGDMKTSEYLNELVSVKNSIKNALISNGITPGEGLSSYADGVRQIQTGEDVPVIPDGTKFQYSTLTEFPYMDTSNVTNMAGMFFDNYYLTAIPQLDTSNVTDMASMFYRCYRLTTIPQMDTSNVKNMDYMFYKCVDLTTIPQIDCSSVLEMSRMFEDCESLTSIPQMDTSNVTSMVYIFKGCDSLTSIGLIDCGSVTSYTPPFGSTTYTNLTDIGGFKDLKVSWSYNFLNNVPNATVESLMNVINNVYDLKANGLSGQKLNFGSTNLNKLTDDQIAIATAKGWTLT